MVAFTGLGCGGAGSFLGGVSMVDIDGRAFLRTSASGLGSVWLYAKALPGGDAGVVGSGWPGALVVLAAVGAARSGYGRCLRQRRPDSGLASHADLSGRHMSAAVAGGSVGDGFDAAYRDAE